MSDLTGKRYDLLVLGAGIAGCEAAVCAAVNGAEVLLVDMSLDRMGYPAHLPLLFVGTEGMEDLHGRLEGTLFGRALETSFLGCFELPYSGNKIILFDRREHSLASKDILEKVELLDARQALINSIKTEETIQVKSAFEEVFSAKYAALSPGCYVKGRIRAGNVEFKAGRYGDLSSEELEESLRNNGVELKEWQGYAHGTLDIRTLNTENWNKAEECESPFDRKKAAAGKTGQARLVLWRKHGAGHQLLIPLGPHSTEAHLLDAETLGPAGGSENRKSLVRGGNAQKSLILRDRGSGLPETVAFAGSFAGAKGYLDCLSGGREAATTLLGKA